jgi:amidohydrolase
MAYFLEAVPGSFFFLGAARPGAAPAAPHHSPAFDIDESALPCGVAVFEEAVVRFLEDPEPWLAPGA